VEKGKALRDEALHSDAGNSYDTEQEKAMLVQYKWARTGNLADVSCSLHVKSKGKYNITEDIRVSYSQLLLIFSYPWTGISRRSHINFNPNVVLGTQTKPPLEATTTSTVRHILSSTDCQSKGASYAIPLSPVSIKCKTCAKLLASRDSAQRVREKQEESARSVARCRNQRQCICKKDL
jgi:hypothetical protein